MKTIVAVALLTLSTVLQAQVGAKLDSISLPEFGGAKVLHHCQVIELQAETVKVSHDDGISVVALQFLPKNLQKNVRDHNEAANAPLKEALTVAEADEQKAADAKAAAGTNPAASAESTSKVSSEPAPAATDANGAAEKDPEMMARRHQSKANPPSSNSNPSNYPVATIPGPTERKTTPRERLIPIPVPPYYRPISPPIVATPQFDVLPVPDQ